MAQKGLGLYYACTLPPVSSGITPFGTEGRPCPSHRRSSPLDLPPHELLTTVIHGDPHIGNLFDDHGRTGFLDWGIISTGTPLRDVSYFLNVGLSIADRQAHERALLRHYLDIWNASAPSPIGLDEAWLAHRIHGAYTVLACCQIVTFAESSDEQRIFSEAFLARAEAAVADLDSLAALRDAGIS